jgi:hypothetical protein
MAAVGLPRRVRRMSVRLLARAQHRGRVWPAVALAVIAASTIVFLTVLRPVIFPPSSRVGASCGNAVNGPQGYNSDPPDCLWSAYRRGQSAQAVIVDITPEGDPITYTVEVSSAAVRVSIQSKDKFGPQGLFVYACGGLTQKAATNGSGHFYLVATGCTGPQGFLDDSGDVTVP